MKRLIFIPLMIVLAASCGLLDQKERAIISGKIFHDPGGIVILKEIEPGRLRTIDSVRLSPAGDFSLKVEPGGEAFYALFFSGNQKVILSVKDGDKITISGDKTSPVSGFEVSGSKETNDLRDFYGETAMNREIADSLESKLKDLSGTEEFFKTSISYDTIFKAILDSQRKLEMDYIRNHPSSLSSLLVLYFSFGPEPVLTFEKDSALFLSLDKSLTAKFPQNKHVLAHHRRIEDYRQAEILKSKSEKEREQK